MNSSDVDIEHMRTAIGRLLDHDNRYGGDAVAAAAVQVWRTGRRKLDRGLVPDGSHAEYVSTVAEVAQIAGWLLFDAGERESSRAAFVESQMLARHAGDRPMKWFALDMLAMHSIEYHRPDESLRIADDVLSDSRVPPRVALLARIRKARALADTGSRRRAMREFTAARSGLEDSITTRDPSWTWWVDERELSGHEGESLLALGEPNAAVPKLRRALDLATESNSNRRVILYYSVALLTAYASGRAWRECESTLLSMPPLLEEVASGRSRRRLRATLHEIARTPGSPHWLSDLAREMTAAPQLSGSCC
ncbi:XRE family transcriptional regulator [Streptomyces olivoreticuli]|uniref:XRE family transcriptional regulator n=1 Tax=Streptomyces olivoreticuli TaxID=68246 RepID=UPI00265AAEDC|nr:XRE family transcriptional regulator [Streptomyces olivoreticuli]WKK22183.1 XRE family transcriptional regulator [Streptomyces olivoreticuli]